MMKLQKAESWRRERCKGSIKAESLLVLDGGRMEGSKAEPQPDKLRAKAR